MKAVWNGETVAESNDIVTVEGNAYFPVSSVRPGVLVASTHTSVCPWKGTAQYHSLKVGEAVNQNAVWFYPAPKSAVENIKDRVA
ncbi:MAG: DUF427 domain-containing protein, partial [Janthinobacterium lividum]